MKRGILFLKTSNFMHPILHKSKILGHPTLLFQPFQIIQNAQAQKVVPKSSKLSDATFYMQREVEVRDYLPISFMHFSTSSSGTLISCILCHFQIDRKDRFFIY